MSLWRSASDERRHGDGLVDCQGDSDPLGAFSSVRTTGGSPRRCFAAAAAKLAHILSSAGSRPSGGILPQPPRPPWRITRLLSSTYLSQGAVRPLPQDASGRTAPPLGLFFSPRIVAIQGEVLLRTISCRRTCAGGTRFGIAVLPLRQTIPGFCSTQPLDCPFQILRSVSTPAGGRAFDLYNHRMVAQRQHERVNVGQGLYWRRACRRIIDPDSRVPSTQVHRDVVRAPCEPLIPNHQFECTVAL